MTSKVAAVTGCAGFIGSHLTEQLLRDGWRVLGIDCFNDNYARKQKLANLAEVRDHPRFEFVPVDLVRGDVKELLAEARTIYHLAAEPGVRASWGGRFERYVDSNVLATQRVLDAAVGRAETRVVYASSSSVYGQAEALPTNEAVTPSPASPYGLTKLSGEQLCRMYRESFGVQSVVLRYFTVFGPRQRPDMAFHIFCRAALLGTPVQIYGDGSQSRDFTFVEDVVAATRAAGEADGPLQPVYNVGGGLRATVTEALDIIDGLSGGPAIQRVFAAPQEGDVRATGADTTAARRDLGYRPSTSLPDGLAAQFDWMQQWLADH